MDMERSLRVWASSELAAVSDPEESGSASPEQRLLIESRRSARWASIAQDDLALVVFDWRTTPRQIALVAESLESLDLDALADQFYRRVFAGGPALAAMFTSDPAVQRGRFTTELAALVGSIQRLDTFCSSAHALGARHRDYGARAAHYRVMGQALLSTLAAALGSRWTADVEEAWTLSYNLTAETMMTGALQRPPPS
jgi:nitric oxide dioxygenase